MSPHQLPKKSANYRRTNSKHKRCGTCIFFTPLHHCEKVLGKVATVGVCDLQQMRVE